MKKVLQTIVDSGKGNCMQAVMASLFETELEDMPDFINMGNEWWEAMNNVYKQHGYEGIMCFNPKNRIDLTKKMLAHDKGVKGYWYASVSSQTFPDVTHAVVIDKNMNIVHDPNPNQKALLLKPEDILLIDIVGRNWHISVKGKLIIEKE